MYFFLLLLLYPALPLPSPSPFLSLTHTSFLLFPYSSLPLPSPSLSFTPTSPLSDGQARGNILPIDIQQHFNQQIIDLNDTLNIQPLDHNILLKLSNQQNILIWATKE